MKSRVPQGGVLSSVLFAIYVAELTLILEESGVLVSSLQMISRSIGKLNAERIHRALEKFYEWSNLEVTFCFQEKCTHEIERVGVLCSLSVAVHVPYPSMSWNRR